MQTALDTLRKKRVRLVDTPAGYVAQVNDSAIVNMVAYQMLSDGTRGPEMKNIAAGEGVEVVLEEGRFLPGVVENVVGKKAGETVRCWDGFWREGGVRVWGGTDCVYPSDTNATQYNPTQHNNTDCGARDLP